jgi:hypothetical protein
MHGAGAHVSLVRGLEYAAFTLWVSVCAFAPELIWQGFLLLRGHFGLAQAASALFIGVLFAFFVEPLMERLKAGRWELPEEHAHGRGVLLATLVSVAFGFLVVCLHEAIATYVGAAHGGHDNHAGNVDKLAGLSDALDEAMQWASIPAAVTACWFVAGTRPRLAIPATVLACAWIVAAGILYDWGWQVVTTSAIPCCLLTILGTRKVLQRWNSGTIPSLARLTARVTLTWLILAPAADWMVTWLGGPSLDFYSAAAVGDDLRFYLGWCLGLFVAPNPVPDEAPAARG